MKGDLEDYIYGVVQKVSLLYLVMECIQMDCLRFDSDVEGFRRGFKGGSSFEEVVLSSDGNFSEGNFVYSVSGICTRLS